MTKVKLCFISWLSETGNFKRETQIDFYSHFSCHFFLMKHISNCEHNCGKFERKLRNVMNILEILLTSYRPSARSVVKYQTEIFFVQTEPVGRGLYKLKLMKSR